MTLDVLIGAAGFVATVLVVAAMILLAPRGTEPAGAAPELADAPGDATMLAAQGDNVPV